MKRILLSLFLVATVGLTFAQDGDRKIENDPVAAKILDAVSTKFLSFETLEVDFDVEVSDVSDPSMKETFGGSMKMKGEKYRLETDLFVIVTDNFKRWMFIITDNNEGGKPEGELQINFYEPAEGDLESPSQLFTIYKEGFFYRMLSNETLNGKSLKRIQLLPENREDSPYEKINLSINTTDNTIAKAVIYNKDNSLYTWTITSLKPDINLSEDTFKFDPTKYNIVHTEDMTE